ncbi:hypothetical protein Tco_0333236 [Tanacetum coccineum]
MVNHNSSSVSHWLRPPSMLNPIKIRCLMLYLDINERNYLSSRTFPVTDYSGLPQTHGERIRSLGTEPVLGRVGARRGGTGSSRVDGGLGGGERIAAFQDTAIRCSAHDLIYLENKMKEAVDVAVQLKSDRIREEAQAKNQQFLDSIDEGMKKVIKEQVKSEVSKITPQIEKLVNEQLESEVLLYKALVDAYEADKILLDTYGDTVTLKRPRDGADDDQEPSAGTDRGSKRRRSGKEPESTSTPREKTTTTARKTTTGFHDEQPKEEVHPLPDWFQQPKRLPSPDHAWNKSIPTDHESV